MVSTIPIALKMWVARRLISDIGLVSMFIYLGVCRTLGLSPSQVAFAVRFWKRVYFFASQLPTSISCKPAYHCTLHDIQKAILYSQANGLCRIDGCGIFRCFRRVPLFSLTRTQYISPPVISKTFLTPWLCRLARSKSSASHRLRRCFIIK